MALTTNTEVGPATPAKGFQEKKTCRETIMPKRWVQQGFESVDSPQYIEKFLDEIISVCKKYDISISHEDGHGGFILEKFDEYNEQWLRNSAMDKSLIVLGVLDT
jgi:hypothetical protein